MRILCNLSVFFHGILGDSLRQSRLPWYPFRLLTAFAATFPKGTASVVAGNFAAAPKGVPLGELSRSD